MNHVLTRAHDRLQAIRANIDVLVTERESISNFLRVYATFAGDEKAVAVPPEGDRVAPSPSTNEPGQGTVSSGDYQREPASVPLVSESLRDADAQRSTAGPNSHPVANVEEEANGAIAAASVDPASREDETDHPRHRSTSGLIGEGEAASVVLPTISEPGLTNTATDGGPVDATMATAPARRKGLQHEVKLAHEAHPDWHAGRIAEELHCGVEYVRSAAARLGITLPTRTPPRGPVSLRDRVDVLRRQHPTWTPRMIATELGANLGTVRIYITDAKREPDAAPAINETAMQAETIDRKRRLGVAV